MYNKKTIIMSYIKKIIWSALLLWGFSLKAQTINIASGADMKYIMPEIVALYNQQNPEIKFDIMYGSAGMFYEQILLGASYDLFFSDDVKYTRQLHEQGFTEGGEQTYAWGSMVLWSLVFDLSKGVEVLNDYKVKRVAIANPQHVPMGARAVESLQYYGIYQNISNKIILGDNVNQAARYASDETAEVALIAISLALAPEVAARGHYCKLDPVSYKPIEQSCAQIKQKHQKPNNKAREFMDFVLSSKCKPVFEKYGYEMPNNVENPKIMAER
jgi:molybdate transport system substrate-binding protein